jgi:hypothetical protein
MDRVAIAYWKGQAFLSYDGFNIPERHWDNLEMVASVYREFADVLLLGDLVGREIDFAVDEGKRITAFRDRTPRRQSTGL